MRDRHGAGYGLRRPGADGVHDRRLRVRDAVPLGFGVIVGRGVRHGAEVGGQILGSEGPSLRKRTVRNENTGEILPISSEKS